MASQLYKGLDPLATTAPPVVNNLTSTSTTSALSAYQGKVLNDMVIPVDVMSKLTLNTDYFSNNGNGLLLKIGNLVYISMGITIKQTTTGGLNPVFTVTSDIKPKQGSRLVMFGTGNSAIRMTCDANQTSGFRTIGDNPPVTANTEIYISGVWVIDN